MSKVVLCKIEQKLRTRGPSTPAGPVVPRTLTCYQMRTITHRFLRVACCVATASSVVAGSWLRLYHARPFTYVCRTPGKKPSILPRGHHGCYRICRHPQQLGPAPLGQQLVGCIAESASADM